MTLLEAEAYLPEPESIYRTGATYLLKPHLLSNGQAGASYTLPRIDSRKTPDKIIPMQGGRARYQWSQLSDEDLRHAARYYLWLAEAYPDLHTDRLQEVIAEAARRGKPEILQEARNSVSR